MYIFLALLFFTLPFILIAGLIRPQVFSALTEGKIITRGKGTLAALGAGVLLLTGAGMTAPETEQDDTTRQPIASTATISPEKNTPSEKKQPARQSETAETPETTEEKPAPQAVDKAPETKRTQETIASAPVTTPPAPKPAAQPQPQPAPAAPTPQPQQNCAIKGNISSSKEKIYHVPGGAYYDVTKIDPSKGERWFCSETEAINAGWRASKR